MHNTIHYDYLVNFCQNDKGETDPLICYLMLDGNTIEVVCFDEIVKTYLPHTYQEYNVKFTIID